MFAQLFASTKIKLRSNEYLLTISDSVLTVILDRFKISFDDLLNYPKLTELVKNHVIVRFEGNQIVTLSNNRFSYDKQQKRINNFKYMELEDNTYRLTGILLLEDDPFKTYCDVINGVPREIYLEGPIRVIEIYIPRYKKHFYLLGDMHVHERTCPNDVNGKPVKPVNIVRFLKDVAGPKMGYFDKRMKDETADIFIEISHAFGDDSENINRLGREFVPNESLSKSYLMDLRLALKDCLQYEKTKCFDQRNRYHWSDSRFRGIFAEWMDTVLNSMTFMNFIPMMAPDVVNDVMTKIILRAQELMKRTPVDLDDVFREAKVSKQLENIEDDDLRQNLKLYYSNILRKRWVGVHKSLRNFDVKKDNLMSGINIILEVLRSLSYLMDAYVMARSFRSFKDKDGRKSQMNYIIVYAGNLHIETMYQFLKSLDGADVKFLKLSNENNVDKQCPKVIVPWFK